MTKYSLSQQINGVSKLLHNNGIPNNATAAWNFCRQYLEDLGAPIHLDPDGCAHKNLELNMTPIQETWDQFQLHVKVQPPIITEYDNKIFAACLANLKPSYYRFMIPQGEVINLFPGSQDYYVNLKDVSEIHKFYNDSYYISQKRKNPNFKYFRVFQYL